MCRMILNMQGGAGTYLHLDIENTHSPFLSYVLYSLLTRPIVIR